MFTFKRSLLTYCSAATELFSKGETSKNFKSKAFSRKVTVLPIIITLTTNYSIKEMFMLLSVLSIWITIIRMIKLISRRTTPLYWIVTFRLCGWVVRVPDHWLIQYRLLFRDPIHMCTWTTHFCMVPGNHNPVVLYCLN